MTKLRTEILQPMKTKLDGIEAGAKNNIVRETADTAVAAAILDKLYVKQDSDGVIETIKIKTKRKTPFFTLTVADLDDNQYGYAASGYDGVDMGGSAQLNGLGALSEHVGTVFSGEFEQVGDATRFGIGITVTYGLAATDTKMYLVGNTGSYVALFEINLLTGEATRVGASGSFGVNESQPQALTAIGDTIYMVGTINDRLYTVDTTTGIATAVNADGELTQFGYQQTTLWDMETINGVTYTTNGNRLFTIDLEADVITRVSSTSIVNFSVVESAMRGLASIGNTLYGVGATNDCLYTIDTDTGVATRVDSGTVRFGLGTNVNPTGLAAIGNTLYMVDSGYDALYTVDTSDGTATQVGNATQFGESVTVPIGLATIGSILYMVDDDSNALYTINTLTGVATRVGNTINFGVSEITPRGLGAVNGVLYMNGDTNDALYTLNTSSGIATRVNTDAVRHSTRQGHCTGLAAIGDQIYMVGNTPDGLYKLNKDTGVATLIALITDIAQPQGLAAIDDVLYCVDGHTGTDALYILDADTGDATRVGNVNEFGVGENSPNGLTEYAGRLYMVGFDEDFLSKTLEETGRRWTARFPLDTTLVNGNETLNLYLSRGSNKIELIPDPLITDAIAFSSVSEGSIMSHDWTVGDTENNIALYKEDGTPLYEGALEDVYQELELKDLPIGA